MQIGDKVKCDGCGNEIEVEVVNEYPDSENNIGIETYCETCGVWSESFMPVSSKAIQ